MPFVNVKIAGTLEAEQVERLQKQVTALMAEMLGKKAALTAVCVERVATGAWSIDTDPVVIAAHLDAKITAGTNTSEEKARFVAGAHALLHETLGSDLPLATYVVIDEVPGNAWGYGGQTQAQRADARAMTA